jgi:hypothetical protein
MIFLTLLLTYLLGYSVLNVCTPKLHYLEKIGASFLIGLGLETLWMILLDFVGIPLNLMSIYSVSLLTTGLMLYLSYKQESSLLKTLFPYNPFKGKKWTRVNLPWLVIMGFFGYLFYIIAVKCLFWPTFEYDAVSGYDMTAKITAIEGSFRNSLFMETGMPIPRMGLRAIYPPLTQFSFALAYMSGMELSKIMTLMLDINFFILLYGLLRRELTHLNIAFILLMLVTIPELAGHMALSQTNLPQAVYLSTAFYSLYLWYKNEDKPQSLFYLSMLLFSCSTLIRSENIIFCMLAGALVLFNAIQQKTKKAFIQTAIYGLSMITPFVLWMLFLKVYGLKGGEASGLSLEIAYNANKASEWWGLLFGGEKRPLGIVFNKNYYALTSYLYFITLILSSIFIGVYLYLKRNKTGIKTERQGLLKSHLSLIYISLLPFLAYSVFFYFIRYDWDSMENVIIYSYKRGLFTTMILFSIFVASNSLIKRAFDWMTRFMYPKID